MEIVKVKHSHKRNHLISHSNKLTEARYILSVAEQRLVLFLLSLISPEDEDFKDYEIVISEFKKILEIQGKSVYGQTKEVLKKIAGRVIYIPKDNNNYLITHWFSSAEYDEETGSIKISLDKKLKPYLLQLKEQFTKYKLYIITQFKSMYTIRIYMLLKQYQSIGYREIDLVELRQILGIEDNIYTDFKRFKVRVLNQAKKEFDTKNKDTGYYNSDITFELETIRRGRKISRLRFIIKKQAHQEPLPLEFSESKETHPIIALLIQHGLNENVATKFLEDQGEEAISRCVSLYEEKVKNGKVKDKSGGYLVTMLKAGAGEKTESEKKEEIKKQKKKEDKILVAKNKKREEEENKLGKEFRKQEVEKFLSGLSEEEHEELLTQVKEKYPAIKNSIKNLDSPMCLGIILSKIPNFEERKNIYIKEKMEG